MRFSVALLLLAPLLVSCGGWHPLYQDPAQGAPQFDLYSAGCDPNGQVSPSTGTVPQNQVVQFTVTPNSGFEVATYTVNGGTPVNVVSTNPNPAGGVPYQLSVPITQNNYTITFTTMQVPVSNG
jgi:hypothetical protein